jgi:hypothetical protein
MDSRLSDDRTDVDPPLTDVCTKLEGRGEDADEESTTRGARINVHNMRQSCIHDRPDVMSVILTVEPSVEIGLLEE